MPDSPRWDYDPARYSEYTLDGIPAYLGKCRDCAALVSPEPWDMEQHDRFHNQIGAAPLVP
jgi:hypothetical protein